VLSWNFSLITGCGLYTKQSPHTGIPALHNKSGTEHKKHKKRTQEAQEEQRRSAI